MLHTCTPVPQRLPTEGRHPPCWHTHLCLTASLLRAEQKQVIAADFAIACTSACNSTPGPHSTSLQAMAKNQGALTEALAPLEAKLAASQFLAGAELSLADIVYIATLKPAFDKVRPVPHTFVTHLLVTLHAPAWPARVLQEILCTAPAFKDTPPELCTEPSDCASSHCTSRQSRTGAQATFARHIMWQGAKGQSKINQDHGP